METGRIFSVVAINRRIYQDSIIKDYKRML